MLDLTKLKYLKVLGYIFLLVIAIMIGVGIGQSLPSTKTSESKAKSQQTTAEQGLTQNEVKDFLLNYFTKKDLGENRNRYKEFMTDGLYQQEVAKEDEPTSQTYKGFVVDFEFKSAEIYINQDNLQVLTQVNYVNTLLDEKKNYDTAQKNVLNKVTLRLTYVKDSDGKLKVNKMESIILTDQTGDYGILDPSTAESEDASDTTTEASEESTDPSTEDNAS